MLLLFESLFYAWYSAAHVAILGQGFVVNAAMTLVMGVIIALLLLKLIERRPAAELGLALRRQTPRELLVGLAIPCIALLIVVVPLAAGGALRYRTDNGTLLQWLAGCTQLLGLLAIPAAAEEVMFRGYPFQKLVQAAGPVVATVVASLAFALMHGSNPGIDGVALINIFVAGVMLSIAYLKTHSLWFAIAVHLGWNWVTAGPLDLPVSGLELFDAPLYEPYQFGAAWITGGAFGPEGGLAGSLALLLVMVGVWWYTRNFADA